jgi:hypothetical protein
LHIVGAAQGVASTQFACGLKMKNAPGYLLVSSLLAVYCLAVSEYRSFNTKSCCTPVFTENHSRPEVPGCA